MISLLALYNQGHMQVWTTEPRGHAGCDLCGTRPEMRDWSQKRQDIWHLVVSFWTGATGGSTLRPYFSASDSFARLGPEISR